MLSEIPTISVVICTYTKDRLNLLTKVVESVRVQSLVPDQIIVVVDHNDDLYKRLVMDLRDVVLVESQAQPGLAGARNTGVSVATSEVIAFLDDDAEAAPDWLERVSAFYDDPDVLAVGGRVDPVWESGRPSYFTEELDWIVGCSYRGLPRMAAEVRNLIGANMSFRREVLEHVGGFNEDLGRQAAKPLGCEETEICIRSSLASPGARIVYDPAAVVHHHVPASRGTLSYMLSRAWSEGLSKAHVSHLVGHKRALVSERRYVRRILPRAVLSGIRNWATREDTAGLGQAGAIVAVLASTTGGYLQGRRMAHTTKTAPAAPVAPWRTVT